MNQAVATSYADNRESLNFRSTLDRLDRLDQTLPAVPRESAMSQATLMAQVGAVVRTEMFRKPVNLDRCYLLKREQVKLDTASALELAKALEQSVGQERWRFFLRDGPGRPALCFFQSLSAADVKQLGQIMSQVASRPNTSTSDRVVLQKWSRLLTACASLGITQVWRWSPMRLEQIIKERRAELQPDPSRRLVVVFKGFIDTQGALAEGGIEKGLMDSSKNRVLVYEVSSQRDVQAALERLHAAGLKLDGLVIRAHSWQRGAQLGSEYLHPSREWLKLKYFRDGASIVWAGCDTGAGGKEYENAGTNTRLVLSEQGESSKIRIFSAGGLVSGAAHETVKQRSYSGKKAKSSTSFGRTVELALRR